MVQENNIPDVTITGFVNQSQVGEVYAAADILALPSENEPWGLVINEAMNFSLPIVASDRVGSVANLVRPGENGFVVDHRSDHELAAALRTLVMDPGLRQAYGKQSREIINEYSLERAAEALVDGVRRAVVKSGARS
jgi:glycosyltransferase involved in cell wall biosynthesis